MFPVFHQFSPYFTCFFTTSPDVFSMFSSYLICFSTIFTHSLCVLPVFSPYFLQYSLWLFSASGSFSTVLLFVPLFKPSSASLLVCKPVSVACRDFSNQILSCHQRFFVAAASIVAARLVFVNPALEPCNVKNSTNVFVFVLRCPNFLLICDFALVEGYAEGNGFNFRGNPSSPLLLLLFLPELRHPPLSFSPRGSRVIIPH